MPQLPAQPSEIFRMGIAKIKFQRICELTSKNAQLMMLLFTLCSVATVSITRVLKDDLPLTEILFIRTLIGISIIYLTVYVIYKSNLRFPRRATILYILNWFFYTVGVFSLFLSVDNVGASISQTATFLSPILIVTLSWIFLKEQVSVGMALVFALGLIGTWMILQPNQSESIWDYVFPLTCAAGYGVSGFVKRKVKLVANTNAYNQVFYQYLSIIISCVIFYFLVDWLDIASSWSQDWRFLYSAWSVPNIEEWAWLLLMSLFNLLLQLSLVQALSLKPSVNTQAIQYFSLMPLIAIEIAVYSEWPNLLAVAGMIAICAMGYLQIRWRN